MLLYDQNNIGPSSEIFGYLWKSSIIFAKCPKNVSKHLSFLQNNFGKSPGIFRKWSEIFGKSPKTLSLECLHNKQNITACLWIWILYPCVQLDISLTCWAHLWDIELNTKIHIHVRSFNIVYISCKGNQLILIVILIWLSLNAY